MAISCERQIPNVPGLKDQEITVGRHVFLQCAGDWEKSFQFTQAKMILAENSKFAAKVYKAEARSANQFDVDLVFYSAGEFMFPDLILSDGTNEIHLGEQKFLVQTVLEKAQAEKKTRALSAIFSDQTFVASKLSYRVPSTDRSCCRSSGLEHSKALSLPSADGKAKRLSIIRRA